MTLYLRLALLLGLLGLLAAQDWYVYRKGQQSIISNVIAGTASFEKTVAKRAKVDVQQTTTDTQQVTQLEAQRDELRTQLAKKPHVVYKTRNSEAMPEVDSSTSCTMSDSILDELRAAASATDTGSH